MTCNLIYGPLSIKNHFAHWIRLYFRELLDIMRIPVRHTNVVSGTSYVSDWKWKLFCHKSFDSFWYGCKQTKCNHTLEKKICENNVWKWILTTPTDAQAGPASIEGLHRFACIWKRMCFQNVKGVILRVHSVGMLETQGNRFKSWFRLTSLQIVGLTTDKGISGYNKWLG